MFIKGIIFFEMKKSALSAKSAGKNTSSKKSASSAKSAGVKHLRQSAKSAGAKHVKKNLRHPRNQRENNISERIFKNKYPEPT